MIRLLRALFGIYGALIFALLLLLVAPCYLFIFSLAPKKKAPHIAHRWVSRNWASLILTFYFIGVKIRNADLIDENKTYVFIANHRSQLDVPAYAVACRNTIRFLAKEELTKIPFMGYIIRNLYISVNRKSKEDRQRSLDAMHQSLKDGISVFLCPEGTRNKTPEPLLDFRDGAFRLAIEAQIPLAILTVKNSGNLLSPLRPLELSPGVLECIWSKPIETLGMTEHDLPILKEAARKLMIESLNH
jgi:1-acyl-sn-glycerol-3-phosphate acyltransferase